MGNKKLISSRKELSNRGKVSVIIHPVCRLSIGNRGFNVDSLRRGISTRSSLDILVEYGVPLHAHKLKKNVVYKMLLS